MKISEVREVDGILYCDDGTIIDHLDQQDNRIFGNALRNFLGLNNLYHEDYTDASMYMRQPNTEYERAFLDRQGVAPSH